MQLYRRLLGIALFLAVLVLGWRFAATNAQRVGVNYLAGAAPDVPLWGALLAAFGSGAAAVFVLGLYPYAKQGMLARRYRRAVHDLEAEVHQLRNLPLSAGEDPRARGGAGARFPRREALKRGA